MRICYLCKGVTYKDLQYHGECFKQLKIEYKELRKQTDIANGFYDGLVSDARTSTYAHNQRRRKYLVV